MGRTSVRFLLKLAGFDIAALVLCPGNVGLLWSRSKIWGSFAFEKCLHNDLLWVLYPFVVASCLLCG